MAVATGAPCANSLSAWFPTTALSRDFRQTPPVQTYIDFNCDLGEGCGNDAAILPLISSASLACGFHAGDALSLRDAIAACRDAGVAIGAHPSFDDREHFGRREHALPPADIYALVSYQVAATLVLTRAAGVQLAHVKPHGALYSLAARDTACATAIAQAVRDVDPALRLYGLAGSALTTAGESAGLATVHEVFAERRYESNGQLTARLHADAVINDLDQCLQQVRQMLVHSSASARTGERVPLRADSLCLHGDRADAVEFAKALRSALNNWGVHVRAPGSTV